MAVNVSVSAQTLEFLYSALTGVVLGVIYDLFRILRLHLKSGKIMTAVLDIIYWCVAIGVLSGFVLAVCDGQMRWYIMVGAFLGAFLYICTFSHLFFSAVNIIIKVCVQILHILVRPVYFIAEKFVMFARGIKRKALLRNIKKRADNTQQDL